MKIQKLFLHAFGPFTGTALDFSGSTQLHLIYGPNEAGKSSALRAMADWLSLPGALRRGLLTQPRGAGKNRLTLPQARNSPKWYTRPACSTR